MYNYYFDLVWKIDIALLVFVLLLVVFILSYMATRGYLYKRRIKKLWAIKENVYSLLAAEIKERLVAKSISARETFLTKNISAEIFLDVTINRERDAVFFNHDEQDLFKKYYISKENIDSLQKAARKSLNKWRRIEAMLALGYARIDSSLEILKANLFKKDEDVSYFAALALCQIRNLDSAAALLKFFKERPVYRYKIASFLVQFPEEISSEIVKLIQEKDPDLRVWALRILEDLGSSSCPEAITQLLKDESAEVRAAACECLGRLGNKDAGEVLERCLTDDNWLVRAAAVEALDNLLGKACVPLVIKLLKDNSWRVIDSVKKVLIKHIDTAIRYLEKIFKEEDMLAKRIAMEVIETSGYLEKLYTDLLTWGLKKEKSFAILKGMIQAGASNGLDLAPYGFTADKNRQIIEVLKKIDSNRLSWG